MIALLTKGGLVKPEQIEAVSSSPARFFRCSPPVWFLHARGGGIGGGSSFVEVREGWVHVPESAFAPLVGFELRPSGWVPACESKAADPALEWMVSERGDFSGRQFLQLAVMVGGVTF